LTDAPIRAGLDKVAMLAPGSGYLDAMAGVRLDGSGPAAFARAELGLKLTAGEVFGFTQADYGRSGLTGVAGAGVRLRW
jgi:hypothetical protein